MITRIAIRLALVVTISAALVAVRIHDDPEHVRPDKAFPPISAAMPGHTPDVLTAAGAARDAWIANEERIERERAEAEAAYLADLARNAHTRSTGSSVSARVSGPHSDAWWHAVAICEQGGRNDPYFGYFSIMDGSAGGLDWGTQVAMANAIIARAGDGAWAASCVAMGYAAAPGG